MPGLPGTPILLPYFATRRAWCWVPGVMLFIILLRLVPSLLSFPVAESGGHVDAAATVAGGPGPDRQDREDGVPEGVAGGPRP
jgi:hypothetical protein